MDPASGTPASSKTRFKVELALSPKSKTRFSTASTKVISNSGLSKSGSPPSARPSASSRASSSASRSAALVTLPKAEAKAPNRSKLKPSVGSPSKSLRLLLISGSGSLSVSSIWLLISATSSAASSNALTTSAIRPSEFSTSVPVNVPLVPTSLTTVSVPAPPLNAISATEPL